MTTDLKQAYDYCQVLTKNRARNFYFGFRTLPPKKRRAIYAAYAFCRHCDDIVDEAGTLPEKQRLLAETRTLLDQSFNGTVSGPVFAALRDTASSFDIPAHYFQQVIEGAEMDLERSRYQSFDELREYCYKVASVVGLISIEVFEYSDVVARDHAVDLGIAMQLTNIIRDLKEDAEMGRVYIPQEEMARFGYTEGELEAGVVNDAFRALMAHQVARARDYFERGTRLLPLLAPRSRACPAVLISLYSGILDRIESEHYDVFRRRIGLSTSKKLRLTARAWASSLISPRLLLRA